MLVDDRLLKIGSSNLNNRSLGYDTECDIAIEARPGETRVTDAITEFRCSLLGEHLGVASSEFAATHRETGSLILAIEAHRRPGRTLRPLALPSVNNFEAALADRKLLDPERPRGFWRALTSSPLVRRRFPRSDADQGR